MKNRDVTIKICNRSGKNIVEKSESLMRFCEKNSSFLVLTRRHTGGIQRDVLDAVIQLKLLQNEKEKKRKLRYVQNMSLSDVREMGFSSRSGFVKKIVEQACEIRGEAEAMYEEYKDGEDTLIRDLKPYGLYKRLFSARSFFTWPGIWDICFFDLRCADCSQLEADCFKTPISVGDYMFEDYGFAGKDERIWAKACPHEEYFQFDLTVRQLAGFRRLNIPFDELSRGREAEEGDCGKISK